MRSLSVVRVAIIFEPNGWISFKFWFLLHLSHTIFFLFLFFFIFFRISFSGFFFVYVNMGPYGNQNFKTLFLPPITFESFETFSEYSFE